MTGSKAERGFNYGFQYTANFANGGHANVVAGQSIQVAGQNSYTLYDVANTGQDSGLNKTMSNFVAGETLQPTSSPIWFISKQQFDSSTFQLDRFDAIGKASIAGVTASVDYALYAAQPALGWEYPREGLTGNASYKFLDRWSVDGSLVLDMSRHYYDIRRAGDADLLSGRLFVRAGLYGRMHHAHGEVFVEHQRSGGLSGISGRTGGLPPGHPQSDVDVPAGPAHARRRQGERRALTA